MNILGPCWFNEAIGISASIFYIVATITGFIAFAKGARDRVSFSAVYLTSFSTLVFAMIYPEYLVSGAMEGVGCTRDFRFAFAHNVGALGAIAFHLRTAREHEKAV